MPWDTSLYLAAHKQVVQSQLCWGQGDKMSSIGYSLNARLTYVANLIINVVSLPLAILYVSFGTIVAVSHWDLKHPIFTKSLHWIMTKTNHILLSTLGTVLPSAAYRFREANLAPYVIALRIALISWGFYYALSR